MHLGFTTIHEPEKNSETFYKLRNQTAFDINRLQLGIKNISYLLIERSFPDADAKA